LAFEIATVDHVQLATAPGTEAEAKAEGFYGGLLGFERVPKLPVFAKRGGCWFVRGSLKLQLGVDADFRPVRKAHPGLLVRGFICALRDARSVWSHLSGRTRTCRSCAGATSKTLSETVSS